MAAIQRENRPNRSQANSIELDGDLLDRIASVAHIGHEISTLSIKRPNWISSFDRTGAWVDPLACASPR